MTPAAEHFFQVNGNPEYLGKAEGDMFHHHIAKVLFMCKQAHPDIQTALALLSTWVQCPDKDDYKKLARVMKYLCLTKDLQLRLQAETSHALHWWIDRALAIP